MDTMIHNLSEFLSVLNKYNTQFSRKHKTGGFIFRGMSNASWPLLPGIYREHQEDEITATVSDASSSRKIYQAKEYAILSHFKKEASGLLPHIPMKDDFTWLQYAQHYGVPTRLLDFTANPLVAMYFCCRSESEDNGVIWIINTVSFEYWSNNELICNHLAAEYNRKDLIDSIMQEMQKIRDNSCLEGNYDGRWDKKTRPLMFIPPYIDQRMSAQSSRFLLWGENQSALEDMIKPNNKMQLDTGMNVDFINDEHFLGKMIVPTECKKGIMKELDLLNINEKSIYPGLDGIGIYLNKYYEDNSDDCNDYL
ncbi:MAG: FRG domain-containing protein [Peptococcaceae bacterium]|nr:FRG domain-containing protein [Peptococcaceae bacterium]